MTEFERNMLDYIRNGPSEAMWKALGEHLKGLNRELAETEGNWDKVTLDSRKQVRDCGLYDGWGQEGRRIDEVTLDSRKNDCKALMDKYGW